MGFKLSTSFAGKDLKVIYVTDDVTAKKCFDYLRKVPGKKGLDIETAAKPQFSDDKRAALDPQKSYVRLVQIYDGLDKCFVFDMLNVTEQLVCFYLCDKTQVFVAHNAMFEYRHLTSMGVCFDPPHCSMIMYRLFVHARYPYPEMMKASLEEAVTKCLGERPKKDMGASDWGKLELSQEQILYAGLDPYFTYAVAKVTFPKIKSLGLKRVYDMYIQAQEVLCSMMLEGISLDIELHNKLIEHWTKDRDRLQARLHRFFPMGLNMNSGKQMSEFLISKLDARTIDTWPRAEKTGNLKLDYPTLKLYGEIEIIEPLMQYKKLQKLISAFGKKIHSFIGPDDGRIHPSYSLGYTTTGRLSSSAPNIQQIPARGEGADMRKVFIADGPEYVLLGADYSQIELRAVAIESKDPVMLKAFEEGSDLHTIMAQKVTGKKDPDDIEKLERSVAKIANFSLVYGAGVKSFRKRSKINFDIDLSEKEANRIVQSFKDLYKGVRRWQFEQAKSAAVNPYATTRMGKRRRLSDENYYTCSMNQPIQGSCAEVMILALIKIHNLCKAHPHIKASVKVTVHDEIIVQVLKKFSKKFAERMKECMEEAFLEIYPGATVRGLIDVGIGRNWEEIKG